jgi:hypothetical protein
VYRFEMNPLYKQATLQGIFGAFLFIALIFWPAGTFHYWQGWVFLATFAASTVGFTVYLAIYDKPLLERRLKAGPQHEKDPRHPSQCSFLDIQGGASSSLWLAAQRRGRLRRARSSPVGCGVSECW